MSRTRGDSRASTTPTSPAPAFVRGVQQRAGLGPDSAARRDRLDTFPGDQTLAEPAARVAAGGPGPRAAGGSPAASRPQPATAPSLFPEGYLDHAALGAALRRVAAEFPGRVRLEPLARTMQGREVWLATLGPAADSSPRPPQAGDPDRREPGGRPRRRQPGGARPDRAARRATAAWQQAARPVRRSTSSPGSIPTAPSGVLGRPRAEFRTNLRPIDRDRDGRSGEDGPDDLDGDGLVAQHAGQGRQGDAGRPTPNDPRSLRKADPAKGERPVYSEYAEGIDNDGDGQINEDPPGGVNLNRNWPHRWTEFDPEAGFSPASEPEVARPDPVRLRPPRDRRRLELRPERQPRGRAPRSPSRPSTTPTCRIFAELSRLFNQAEALNASPKATRPAKRGEAPKETAARRREERQAQGEGRRRVEAPGGRPDARRRGGPGEPRTATTDGALSEWAYHQFGVVGLASRLWATPGAARAGRPKASRSPPATATPAGSYWNDQVMGGRAFVPFTPFDHPTLGKVEIGGWKPGVRLNPPIEQVEPIADGPPRLPRGARRAAARPGDPRGQGRGRRGAGIFQVTATVANDGVPPHGPGPGGPHPQGRPGPRPPRPRRREAPRRPGPAQIDALAGSGGHREFRWLVLAPAPGRMPRRRRSPSMPPARRRGRLAR